MNINDINEIGKSAVGSAVSSGAVGVPLSLGASILGNVLNVSTMRNQQKFAAEQAALNREFQRHMFERQATLNSPMSKLAQMRGAGVNVMNGSDIAPSPTGLPSGSMATPPATPQMAVDVGLNSLSGLMQGLASLQQSGVSSFKAPSEVKKNEADAMYQAEITAPTVQVLKEQAGLTAQQIERQKIENLKLPELLESQIGLNKEQANALVEQVSQRWSEIKQNLLIARMTNSTSRYLGSLQLEGTKYSSDSLSETAANQLHAQIKQWATQNGFDSRKIEDAWNIFYFNYIKDNANPFKGSFMHDAYTEFNFLFDFKHQNESPLYQSMRDIRNYHQSRTSQESSSKSVKSSNSRSRRILKVAR